MGDHLNPESVIRLRQNMQDCVQHQFSKINTETVEDADKGVIDIGRKGYFAETHYPDLAHFLVVRKMLSRFRKVQYVMDCSERLYASALTALAPDIKDNRAEIVLFQHKRDSSEAEIEERDDDEGIDYGDGENDNWEKARKSKLNIAWQNMQAEFDKRVKPKDLFPDDEAIFRKRVAQTFRSALSGAYSDTGEWAWLKFPPTNGLYTEPRILWLTWTPDKSYEDIGRDLLWRTTMQPVDSACDFMRERTAGIQRPNFRARPGRSYRSSYFLPRVLSSEMWIMLLWRNYGVRFSSAAKIPPAKVMGLTRPKETIDSKDPKENKQRKEILMFRSVWEFRLGVTQAKRISKWLS